MDFTQKEVKRVTLITSMQQEGWVLANEFNKTGSIMVAGCTDQIKVWKIIGKPKQLRKLQGNEKRVHCIVFSKKLQWFASGGYSGTILSWNAEWICKLAEQKHTNTVTHLLLNKNENELISCSRDNTIIVWKIDCYLNQIDYEYTLENIHNGSYYCLSLNESETYLVSSAKTINLWSKQNNRWKYVNQIENIKAVHICFLSDSICAYSPIQEAKTEILEIKDDQLLRRPELNFEVELDSQNPTFWFPNIYNQKKQIIIQITQGVIYILKKQVDNHLKLVFIPLGCNFNDYRGQLTNDGEILVIWNCRYRVLRMYKIQ